MEIKNKCEDVVWITCPPIPEGTKPFDHQVAGHIFGRLNGHNKNQLGFLQDETGCILKPVQGGTKGLREKRFYEFMSKEFDNNIGYKSIISDYLNKEYTQSDVSLTTKHSNEVCKQMRTLKKFIPTFYGLWSTPVHQGVSYMKLENLTKSMRKPCVMDVKMGCVTYDKFADQAKIERELSKCPALKHLGFQIVGIKVFSPKTNDFFVLERVFLRSLNQNNIIEKGFSVYFNDSCSNQMLMEVFLRRLKDICEWFGEQRTLTFIASSLLFIYDGCLLSEVNQCDVSNGNNDIKCHGEHSNKEEYERLLHKLSDVKMIDFAHVFPSEGKKDLNYLEGLSSLIKYIGMLKK